MSEALSPEQTLYLINTCPTPILVLDQKGVIRNCNPALVAMVGKSKATELVGKSASTLGNPSLGNLLCTEKRISWSDNDGQLHHYEVHYSDTGGDDPLEIRYFVDISRQYELEQSQNALREELREQTLTDSVTGLLNQRGVMLALEPQVARSRRYNSPISVITLDVYGTGDDDTLRKQVAQQLKDQLRWADLVGCDDKQAFILILPETGQEATLKLADKLHGQLVEFAQQELPGQTLTAFYGVTAWRRTDSAVTLLKRARLALEQARADQDHQLVAL
jgi:diguanylate cyclase (GGDEF)-like protein